jgi:glycosyltransferase involved in cell wall biosynthesis
MRQPLPFVDQRNAPLVSIVITAFNAQIFIDACIRAALAQTYPNFEVIVVDDGSTDDTARICRSFADERLHYLSWGRIGRPCALNRGIAAASGRYIAINDADDLSFPNRLAYSVAFFQQNPDIAYLGTGSQATDVFLTTIPTQMTIDATASNAETPWWPSRSELFRRNRFNHSTLVFPKSTWESIGGYDEGLSNGEDYDFYLRAMQCGRAALLPRRTVLWYTNPNGFFKQKSVKEYLDAIGRIKSRARRLHGLPLWTFVYHPVWVVYYRVSQRIPAVARSFQRIQRFLVKTQGSESRRA